MSHSWVKSVTLSDDKMTLSVEVTDFEPTTGPIEITGEVTQVNGAWARISSVANRDTATEEGGKYFVDVDAVLTPDHKFTTGKDVTIYVRVSQTWVTVLGPGTGEPVRGPQVGQIWGIYKEDSQLGLPANEKKYPRVHRWVYSVALTDGKMTFHVEITDLKGTTGAIEITGEATQVNGAWARVSSVADRAKATEEATKEGDKYFVDVEGVLTPDHKFNAKEDVTTFVRVSKTWVTVLGPGADKTGRTQIWDNYKEDAQLSPDAQPSSGGW